VSISPIYTAAFSTNTITRGIFTDRPFGGTAENVRTAKNHVQGNAVNATAGLSGQQTAQGINPSESTSKSAERQANKQGYPEKSSDSEKKRSQSGDILDLSGQPKSKAVESAVKSEKVESSSRPGNLTPEEQQQVDKLKARDVEVRAHESAHLSAAGQYAQGGPKYVYQTGPDGKQYAIGGSVSIDVSPVSGDPQATIQKAQQVRTAALAPAEPSGQDQKVAAAASSMEADARMKLAQEKQDKTATVNSDSETLDTYGPFGSLAIGDESSRDSSNDSSKADLESSKQTRRSALSSRRSSDAFEAASTYRQVQTQTSGGRAFAAYA